MALDKTEFNNGRPFQVIDPVFQYPVSQFGHGQLFIPEKMFNGEIFGTLEFNLSVIWLFNLILYVLLLSDIKKK